MVLYARDAYDETAPPHQRIQHEVLLVTSLAGDLARMPCRSGIAIRASREVHPQPHRWTVPKAILMSKLKALLKVTRKSFISGSRTGASLMLAAIFGYFVCSSAGNTMINAREGVHDDLILILGAVSVGDLRYNLAKDRLRPRAELEGFNYPPDKFGQKPKSHIPRDSQSRVFELPLLAPKDFNTL